MENKDLHSQYHGCWWPGDARSQVISNHDIDQDYKNSLHLDVEVALNCMRRYGDTVTVICDAK